MIKKAPALILMQAFLLSVNLLFQLYLKLCSAKNVTFVNIILFLL